MSDGLEIMVQSMRQYMGFVINVSFMNTMLAFILLITVLRLIAYLISSK